MAKADVRTRRFRNAEEQAIEATITSPVPVHAVMFRLRAVIGDLVLEGRVQLRAAARDTYEDGIRRGRTSVLHEEVRLGGGYEWEGRPYRSLSAIARAITGTRWNGWTFFGLKTQRGAA